MGKRASKEQVIEEELDPLEQKRFEAVRGTYWEHSQETDDLLPFMREIAQMYCGVANATTEQCKAIYMALPAGLVLAGIGMGFWHGSARSIIHWHMEHEPQEVLAAIAAVPANDSSGNVD